MKGDPEWISTLDCLKLAPGLSEFTCCERNHVVTTATQDAMSKSREIPCDKPIAMNILITLMRRSFERLQSIDKTLARLNFMLRRWWLRGLEMHLSEQE